MNTTTASPFTSQPGPTRPATAQVIAGMTLTVGVVAALAVLLAGLGYRQGVLPLGGAIGTVRWAATAALVAALVALLVGISNATRERPDVGRTAMAALLLNLLVATPPLWFYHQVQTLPRIHDVSTDTAKPPAFQAVLPLRQGARNPVDYLPATAEQQKAGYPDIVPLALAVPPQAALESAERVARALGWQVVAVDAKIGRLEATATSRLFGFVDDVVVRITPTARGCVVDVRSLSRVGGSDFGANARRVRSFIDRLQRDVV